MPIPDFVNGCLPPGGHHCTWDELEARFGIGEKRQQLTAQLRTFMDVARDCGFVGMAIGGSYPSASPAPGDLDMLFITPMGIDKSTLNQPCVELLDDDTTFQARTGHNAMNCPDEPETLNYLLWGLGYDCKTGRDRGMLVVRFV